MLALCESCPGDPTDGPQEEFHVDILGEKIAQESPAAHALELFPYEPKTCTLCNDLESAVEVQLAQGRGWQVIYPKAELDFGLPESLPVSVRLRDDPCVYGWCNAVKAGHCSIRHAETALDALWARWKRECVAQLKLSRDFEDFGAEAEKHFRKEEEAAAQEARLQKIRQWQISKQMNAEVNRVALRRQACAYFWISLFVVVVLGAMIFCTVKFLLMENEWLGAGLSTSFMVLWLCAWLALVGICAASGEADRHQTAEMESAIQATQPELRSFRLRDPNAAALDGLLDLFTKPSWHHCKILIPLLLTCCTGLVGFGCAIAMTVAALWTGASGKKDEVSPEKIYWLSAFILVIPTLMAVCAYFGSEGDLFETLVQPCGKNLTAFLLQPPKRSVDAAVYTTHQHTIVFEGNVIPNRETVCSWPGKYASAWDALVEGSRQNDISAAVVFLPEGSKHFGLHDPIPSKPSLQDLFLKIALLQTAPPSLGRYSGVGHSRETLERL